GPFLKTRERVRGASEKEHFPKPRRVCGASEKEHFPKQESASAVGDIVGAMAAPVAVLSQVPLFAGLPQEDLEALANRLRPRRYGEIMQDAVFLDVPARLARTILRLAADDTATQEGGRPLTPHLYQSDLAGMVGTTRETLNKWLGVYETQGMIRLVKGRIAVL